MRILCAVCIAGLLIASCGDGGDGGVGVGAGGSGSGGTSGSSGGGASGTGSSGSAVGIQAMTSVDTGAKTGYFQDPAPIRLGSTAVAQAIPMFSGTTHKLLACVQTQISPGCFATTSAITLDTSPFDQKASSAGSKINNVEGLSIYQDSAGAWQMTATVHLQSLSDPSSGWGVIMHAHPDSVSSGVPTAWTADAVLVGDLGKSAPDNYGGKYFEDAGMLYLVYSAYLGPNLDGLVAQAMKSASEKASSAPVTILGPETANGGYNSEIAGGVGSSSPVRLIEGGNIVKINGKYVMTYSDGTFDRTDYKSGVAYSDTFLPVGGAQYRRVLAADANGVWGQANHNEIVYLLQSQIAQWPNYVASQVLAPGVPAIISDGSGSLFLAFAGYNPTDVPTKSSGLFDGSYRRPYYVRLTVNIPTGSSVKATSDKELATWLQPALQ